MATPPGKGPRRPSFVNPAALRDAAKEKLGLGAKPKTPAAPLDPVAAAEAERMALETKAAETLAALERAQRIAQETAESTKAALDRARVTELTAKVTAAEGKVTRSSSELSDMEQQLAELTRAIERKKATLESERKEFERTKRDADAEIAKLTGKPAVEIAKPPVMHSPQANAAAHGTPSRRDSSESNSSIGAPPPIPTKPVVNPNRRPLPPPRPGQKRGGGEEDVL